MTSSKKLSFEEKFLRWRKKEGLKGPEAIDRFAFFSFIEAIKEVSDDFVLKGGNLLWIYTKTPRETVDLDFSTLNLNSHLEVKEVIEKACHSLEDIEFKVEEFREMNHENMFGSRFKMVFKSKGGATNKFQVDIVYKLSTDLRKIKTP
ncbi:MAG: nucleotidyl transferase AbiEii/AbiGii toxin family protein, partial [Bacteriovoracaceae bacterium]